MTLKHHSAASRKGARIRKLMLAARDPLCSRCRKPKESDRPTEAYCRSCRMEYQREYRALVRERAARTFPRETSAGNQQ